MYVVYFLILQQDNKKTHTHPSTLSQLAANMFYSQHFRSLLMVFRRKYVCALGVDTGDHKLFLSF